MTRAIRNGIGTKAYRRKALQLKHRTAKHGLPCTWCGQPIDTTLPWADPMAFTADHVTALANDGDLLGPLEPQHRRCNAQKGTSQLPTIRPAT